MISGIIKLFYNDKVKSEMKKMKDESYIFLKLRLLVLS